MRGSVARGGDAKPIQEKSLGSEQVSMRCLSLNGSRPLAELELDKNI